jgi:diguanylate cyclase (GGDEF)-like protein
LIRFLPILAVVAGALLFLSIGGNSTQDLSFELTTVSEDVTTLSAPGKSRALEPFRDRQLCPNQNWAFETNVLASVYQVHFPAEAFEPDSSWVLYQKAAINNQFAVIYAEPQDCLNIRASGRSLPFDQRIHHSLFPNSQISGLSPTTDVFIVLQDSKSRNLWLGISDPQSFQESSNRKWLYSGLYLGALLIYTLVGLTISIWQKSRLAIAYSAYTLIIALWFLQNFAIGSAFIPFWPPESQFSNLQALFTGLIVVGVASVCLLFLEPSKKLGCFIIIFAAIIVLLFLSSPFFHKGYEYGAFGLALLAVVIIGNLLTGFSTKNSSEKLFALGLICSVSVGSIQAISVFTGSDFGGFAIFAFPIGNLFESTLWLMAIVDRLFREFNRIQVRLLFDATHDSLTKLPNRTFLENRLKAIVSSARQTQDKTVKSIFFVDLDRFKQINDSLGHVTGDHLLNLISNRLRSLDLDVDTLGRFGGDEFCLIMNGIESRDEATALGADIIKEIAQPITLVGRELRLSASIGVCLEIEQYPIAENIMRNADMSMYAAKQNGRSCTVIYSDEMHEMELEKFQIEQDILPGVRKKEFIAYFQPIVHLPSGELAGFEALVRWQHPAMGFLAPYRFIDVAEDTGLIRIISDEVISQVAESISKWKEQGVWSDGLYVSVNIAGQQLLDTALQELLQEKIDQGLITESDIRIEITESSLVTDFARVAETLSNFKKRGFKILIDDFGTGYSSLKYLHLLPIDVLKIDRSFVTDIDINSNKQALIKSIIAMAKELQLDVIAEGVEISAHRELLSEYGCAKAQGYFYDKPQSGAETEQRWLKKAE